MISWPAIISFHGDADLEYVANQAAWDNSPHLLGQSYHLGDRLIDSSGKVFRLRKSNHKLIAQPSAEVLSLDELLQLVRQHAAQDGACCVAKISADSIESAMKLLE